MKLVVSSDWHLDHLTLGVSRFNEIARSVEESVKTAIKEKADRYIFCGDLCDPDKNLSPFRAIEFAQRMAIMLWQQNIPSHWLVGNHDVIEDGSGASTLTPLKALEMLSKEVGEIGIYVHNTPGVTDFGDWMMVAFPFTPISHNYDPTKLAAEIHDNPKPAVVISHLSIEGVIPGEETVQMPRGRDVYLPVGMLSQRKAPTLMISGHYHRRQKTKEGVLICGSMARLNFGEEENQPGYLVVEW